MYSRKYVAGLLLAAVIGCGEGKPARTIPSAASRTEPSAHSKPDEESIGSELAVGQRRLAQGDAEGAGRSAREILLRDPDNARALALAGEAALARGEIDVGVEMLDAASEAWPERSLALYVQATAALWKQNRLEEVEDRFVTLLREHPHYDDARRGLATVLNRRGLRFDANQQIRILCRRPRVQLSIDELRCLVAPSRSYYPFPEKPRIDDRPWIQSMGELNVARALYGEGDIREALTVLEASDLLMQRHSAAVAFHGQVLLESQQFERFERWLDSVESTCEGYPAYWMALGGWALRKQQPAQAVRMFAEAILREPGEVAAHDRMHQALEALGDAETAKRFDRRRIEVRSIVKLTRLIFGNQQISPDAYRELANQLDNVGRPLEAIHWRTLADLKAGLGAEAMRRADLALEQLIASEDLDAKRDALLCGLDLSTFKLNLAKLLPTRKSDESRPAANALQATRPRFVNIARSVGLDFRYVNADPPKERYFLMHEAVGSGIACLDYDRDGRVDLYVGQGACNAPDGRGKLPNLLARNIGRRFQTVTAAAQCDDRRYTLGVTAGDWNQDGFADLIVGNMTRNRLLINQGDGTFREQPGDQLWRDGKYTSSLAIADVTGDHIPDIVEVNYLDDHRIFHPLKLNDQGRPVRFPGPLHFRACHDRLFVGAGDGTMRGRLLSTDSPGRGLGLLVTDIDGRGGNEIFVANDMTANHLWLRSGDAQSLPNESTTNATVFVDAAVARGVAYGPSGAPLACMGIAAADFDENGFLDLHITNFFDQWSNQYMQTEENLFDDLTLPFGLDQSTLKVLGFGTEALDFDNNTTVDLVAGNGHIDDLSHEGTEFAMPTQFFIGDGTTLTLTKVDGDPDYWDANHLTRALVTLDWNHDGRVDFATTDLKEPLALLENQTETEHHWVQLQLVGTSCERDAIGAVVTFLFTDDREIKRVTQTGDGYMSKNESTISVGLGNSTQIRQIEIRWPDGTVQRHAGIAVNRRWLLVQGEAPFRL